MLTIYDLSKKGKTLAFLSFLSFFLNTLTSASPLWAMDEKNVNEESSEYTKRGITTKNTENEDEKFNEDFLKKPKIEKEKSENSLNMSGLKFYTQPPKTSPSSFNNVDNNYGNHQYNRNWHQQDPLNYLLWNPPLNQNPYQGGQNFHSGGFRSGQPNQFYQQQYRVPPSSYGQYQGPSLQLRPQFPQQQHTPQQNQYNPQTQQLTTSQHFPNTSGGGEPDPNNQQLQYTLTYTTSDNVSETKILPGGFDFKTLELPSTTHSLTIVDIIATQSEPGGLPLNVDWSLFPFLTSVTLKGVTLDDESWKKLFTLSTLETLHLHHNGLVVDPTFFLSEENPDLSIEREYPCGVMLNFSLLKSLRNLTIEQNPQILPEYFSPASSLQIISLDYVPEIDREIFEILALLTNLTDIKISNTCKEKSDLYHITKLEDLPHFKKLELSYVNMKPEDLDYFTNLTNITDLDLKGNDLDINLKNLSVLSSLPNLHTLNLVDCGINPMNKEFRKVIKCLKLKKLYLD